MEGGEGGGREVVEERVEGESEVEGVRWITQGHCG